MSVQNVYKCVECIRSAMKNKKTVVAHKLTLKFFKLSTTQPSNASRPMVTVIFGIGSANRGKFNSEKKMKKNYNV